MPFRASPHGAHVRIPEVLVRAGALAASVMLVLAACNTSTTPTSSPTAGPSGAPATAAPTAAPTPGVDTSTLTVALESIGTGEFSPARTGDQNVYAAQPVFETLTMLDPKTGEYVGNIAESFSVSADGLSWDFKLKPNIPYHDGWGTVTASDVKYSWGIWMSKESNHDLGASLGLAVDNDINNIEVVSDLEFKTHSAKPLTTLPSILSDFGNGLQVVPEKYYKEKGAEANNHPIGTGPWKFVSFTPGVEAVYDAVKDHFRAPPAFGRLILKEIPDGAARLAQVQTGAVDMASLDSSLIGEAKAAGLELRTIPNTSNITLILGGSYWGSDWLDKTSPWIQADNPAKGKAIREAMSLAIDRQAILDTVLSGLGSLAQGPLIQNNANPLLSDPSWTAPAFDLALAKQKLAEGGYPNGFPITLFMYPREMDTVGIGEAIAGMWEDLGLQVKRQPGDEGTLDGWLDAIPPGTNGIAWVKPIGIKADVSTQLSGYVKTRENDHKFFWPLLDENYVKMLAEPDATKRYALGKEIVAALRENTVTITLFQSDMPWVVGPKVGTWSPVPGFDEISHLESVMPRK